VESGVNMALAVTVRFDFVDGKNKTSFTKIRVPNGFSIAQYGEFARAMGQLMSNISKARVTSSSITFSVPLDGLSLKLVASIFSDVAQKGYFAFSTLVSGFAKRLRLPTFDETKISVGSDSVDTADLAVAAFIAAMENGIVVTGGTISPCDERQNNIQSLIEAREVFRRKR
jgi:hypothetical protein